MKKTNNPEDLSFKCPACSDGKLIISRAEHKLPDGDLYLIMKIECDKCDFTKSDLIPLETPTKPGKYTLRVNSKEDLESKIFRSFSGILEIPELEMEIEPGPAADFFITNIEGILQRMKNAVSYYNRNLEEKDDKVERILENIDKAINGEFKFTLIINDKMGGSYIVPAKKESLKIEYF